MPMRSLQRCGQWPVDHVSAAVVSPGAVHSYGDIDRQYPLASVSKVLCGWATMVAIEEGLLDLDSDVGQPGCTLRHLLSHAGGYPFDGDEPIATPGRQRIYSNTGIALAAQAVADAADLPFQRYITEAVFAPLAMNSTTLHGSPSVGVTSTVADMTHFLHELINPQLIDASTAAQFTTVQFPLLNGVVPGLGRFSPCPWGLGCEIRGDKTPHWTGTLNSAGTFGHFGGSGTVMWVDPAARAACIALTDRAFDQWSADALRLWPELSDAVLGELSASPQ